MVAGEILEAASSIGILNNNDIAEMDYRAQQTIPIDNPYLTSQNQYDLLNAPPSQSGPVMAGMMPSGFGGLSKSNVNMLMMGAATIAGIMLSRKS